MIDVRSAALERAIELAWISREKGNHPFGALLVNAEGEIVLEAENVAETDRDVTGHAETNLIRLATKEFSPEFLATCTLYTSAEPCVMCCGAIYAGNVRKVVWALGAKAFAEVKAGSTKVIALKIPAAEAFSYGDHAVEVSGPHMEEEARAPHEGYWT